MKDILYIANIRLPTEKAHGVQIMEMCSAFSAQGVNVELVVPKRRNTLIEDPFDFYKIKNNFTISRLSTLDLIRFGRIGFVIQSWTFACTALYYSLTRDVVSYTRDESVAALLAFFGREYVFEPHIAKWNIVQQYVLTRAMLIVPISQGLKDFYAHKGVPEGRMFVAFDAVNLERFIHNEGKIESRKRLLLPISDYIVLYSGHLYPRKGAHTLAEAAKLLDEHTQVIFVGGTDLDILNFKKKYASVANISILGHQSHDEIPYYLSAADVLVLPNSAESDDSRLYTSPMKLFEYMASGVPIVASDVSSLREILSEKNAFFFAPDNSEALAQGIKTLLTDEALARILSLSAKTDVRNFDWKNRAVAIIKQIDERS